MLGKICVIEVTYGDLFSELDRQSKGDETWVDGGRDYALISISPRQFFSKNNIGLEGKAGLALEKLGPPSLTNLLWIYNSSVVELLLAGPSLNVVKSRGSHFAR